MTRPLLWLGVALSLLGCVRYGTVNMRLEGLPKELTLEVQKGQETIPLLTSVVCPPKDCPHVHTDTYAIPGSQGRLMMAQLFKEQGEVSFSRDILAWIVDTYKERVVWSGVGSYTSAFAECETLDAPDPEVVQGELVVRYLVGTRRLKDSSTRCGPTQLKKEERERVKLN